MAPSRAHTKAQAGGMVQPAILCQGGHQLWCKEHWVPGDQGPGPGPPRCCRGSDLGQLPPMPRPPVPHLHCSGLRSKGSVQPWLLGTFHCSPDGPALPPRTSRGRSGLSQEPPMDAASQSPQRPGLRPLLLPPLLQGPGPAPPIHPTFHPLPRARHP